jgi:hypothetical protein
MRQGEALNQFVVRDPSKETLWRSLILFGNNVQSYKFALGKSLISLARDGKEIIPLADLALPFAHNLCEHLKKSDVQGTSKSSKFLKACRGYNDGSLTEESLRNSTQKLGFKNVLKAFHILDRNESPIRYFISETNTTQTEGNIRLTNELLEMVRGEQEMNLPHEVESRWRLVEESWRLGISAKLLQVHYDPLEEQLYLPHANPKERTTITSSRGALNGYQRGKCFYCFGTITVDTNDPNLADVDHFFPHTLAHRGLDLSKCNIDGVWNLVLACKGCNRGEMGKFSQFAHQDLLQRLLNRNEFLISSHHPLRETLMCQTGGSIELRVSFLQNTYDFAIGLLGGPWKPVLKANPTF